MSRWVNGELVLAQRRNINALLADLVFSGWLPFTEQRWIFDNG